MTCRRCERPICPECMIQAPVGWQCPECVKSGARQSRVIRYRPSPAGTRAGVPWREAPVTIGLVIINVIAFLISGEGKFSFLAKWGLVPSEVQSGQIYRLFTSPFLHVSVAHIGLNMLSLVLVGCQVEVAIGRVRYVVLYLASAMGGSVLTYLIAPPNEIGVGASGAIFGVFGAYFIVARARGLQTGGIAGLIAFNLIYGFVVPDIGWQAHIGGLIVGAAVSFGYVMAERRPASTARALEVATCVAVAVVLFGVMQLPART